jgi:hypothetical protein
MEYEIAHRPDVDSASELLVVDARTSSAAITAAQDRIPEENSVLFVRPHDPGLRD